jgi:hypothetical protein
VREWREAESDQKRSRKWALVVRRKRLEGLEEVERVAFHANEMIPRQRFFAAAIRSRLPANLRG